MHEEIYSGMYNEMYKGEQTRLSYSVLIDRVNYLEAHCGIKSCTINNYICWYASKPENPWSISKLHLYNSLEQDFIILNTFLDMVDCLIESLESEYEIPLASRFMHKNIFYWCDVIMDNIHNREYVVKVATQFKDILTANLQQEEKYHTDAYSYEDYFSKQKQLFFNKESMLLSMHDHPEFKNPLSYKPQY